jgi:hypothetical protein
MAQKQCPLRNIQAQEKNNEQIFFKIGARPFISAWKKNGCVLKGEKQCQRTYTTALKINGT